MTRLGETLRMAPDACPWCGKAFDAVTPTGEGSASPRPGDLSMCLGCGRVMAFGPDLKLRKATAEEDQAARRRSPALFEAWRQTKAERQRRRPF